MHPQEACILIKLSYKLMNIVTTKENWDTLPPMRTSLGGKKKAASGGATSWLLKASSDRWLEVQFPNQLQVPK